MQRIELPANLEIGSVSIVPTVEVEFEKTSEGVKVQTLTLNGQELALDAFTLADIEEEIETLYP